jgi:23S rRNA (cytosine1962-C5)-methyltransferase
MYLKLGDGMLTVVLIKNEEKEEIEGFPWVFNKEINSFKGDNIVSGEVVRVVTFDGKFVAYGFLNTSSKIMVRILSRNEEDVIDREFFKRKM